MYVCICIRLKITPNSVRISFQSCQIFVLPSTGFEPTPLMHCSTIRLALRPAHQTTRPHPLPVCIYIYIRLKIKPKSVRIRSGFELAPLIHCSTNRLALCPAPQTTRPHLLYKNIASIVEVLPCLVYIYMIDSDRRPVSNRRPLFKLASTNVISQIKVRFKGILKSVSFPNSQSYSMFDF